MGQAVREAAPLRRAILFGALLAWCVALIGFRVVHTRSGGFVFMVWNLFLACVPLMASFLLRALHVNRSADIAQLMLLGLWLLFLPNAPYLVTDIVHLEPSTPLLYGYDLALILSCAFTGLLLGYASLLDVHTIFAERFGHKLGWTAAISALLLSGYGVYLGRVQRWNSWDLFTHPQSLLAEMAKCLINPLQHLHTYAFTAVMSGTLVLGYAALNAMRWTQWLRINDRSQLIG
jgi:uncharacterized membrane protein